MSRLKTMPTDSMTVRVALGAVTLLVVSIHSSLFARAESDSPEPAAILNGLAPEHLGRIAGPSLDGRGFEIAPSDVDVLKGRRESQVAGPAAVALAPPPPGVADQRELTAEIATRFEQLEGCRLEVARRRQVSRSDIEADRLTLRWSIAETGQAIAAEVVGTTAVDPEVLDCVKLQMRAWTFSRPSGKTPVPIERIFTFRPAPSPHGLQPPR